MIKPIIGVAMLVTPFIALAVLGLIFIGWKIFIAFLAVLVLIVWVQIASWLLDQ